MRIATIFVLGFALNRIAAAQVGCGLAQDLVVRSLENLNTSASASDVEDGIQLLRQAIRVCPTSGDAWYYRSLFEQRLGPTHKNFADVALAEAKRFNSSAMRNGINPFVLASPPQPRVVLPPVRQKWALVVGIGKFQSSRIPRLNFAQKDASDFAAWLEDPQLGRFDAEHVRVLTDSEATLVNIKAALNWMAGHAKSSDLVVVFLASHGTGREKDPVGHLNYVLVYDTDTSNDDRLYATTLPMIDVSDIVRSRIPARRTVVLLDACHSEGSATGLLRPATASNTMLDAMKAGVGRLIIASSQQDQLSYESNTLENGLFTHFLIEGLKQDGGNLPMSKVFVYLEQHVRAQSLSEGNPVQTPVMVRSEQGDEIVLGVPGASTVAGRASFAFTPFLPIATR